MILRKLLRAYQDLLGSHNCVTNKLTILGDCIHPINDRDCIRRHNRL